MRVRVNPIRLMVVVAVIGLVVLIFQDVHGEEAKSYFKKSVIDSRKTVVYFPNDNGQDKAQGFLRQSLLDPRKTVVYDEDGKEKGFLRESVLDPRKTVYYSVEDD